MSNKPQHNTIKANTLSSNSIKSIPQSKQELVEKAKQRQPVSYYPQNGSLAFIESDPQKLVLSLEETTGAENPGTALNLIQQVRNALPNPQDMQAVNTAMDLMNSIQPQTPMEGMLAVQMVACHTMAMTFAQRAMAPGQPDKAIESNINRSTKLARLFSQQLEALNKMRHQGQQTIQVQHVHLDGVQQAIVGNNVGLPTPGRGEG